MKELSIIQLHQKVLVWQSQRMYTSRHNIDRFLGGGARMDVSEWMAELIEKKFWESKSTICKTIMCTDFEYFG